MSVSTNVTKALNSAVEYGKAIEAIKTECKGKDRDTVRSLMLSPIASFYAVPLNDKGNLDREAKQYEAAKKALQRMLNDVCGKATHGKTEIVKVAKVKVAAALDIVEGMTKQEFNAWLSAVRAAVSFE